MRNVQLHIIAVAGFLLIAESAYAAIDDQCVQSWIHVTSAEALGRKCNWLAPAATQKLKASQDRAYACSIAKATAAEKSDVETARIPKAQEWVNKNFANAPCDAKAKQFFDAQVAH